MPVFLKIILPSIVCLFLVVIFDASKLIQTLAVISVSLSFLIVFIRSIVIAKNTPKNKLHVTKRGKENKWLR